jgi:hypothetical protein
VDVSVYLPLVLGVLLTALTPWIVRLLPPRTGVWVLSAAAVTAAASWVFSLAMLGFTGLGRITFVADKGHWSATVWRRMDPVGVWTARAAGVVLATCLLTFGYALAREMLTRREINRVTSRFATGETLVFVDDDVPHAYSVGGRRPRIVVSRGLLRAMTTSERRAVLAHEAAHVRLRHSAHLTTLRLAAGLSPLLRPFVGVGELAVERWADEETAVALGDRTLVARALLRAALATTDRGRRPRSALAHASGDVGRRIRALLAAPPRPRRSMAAAAWVLLAATITAPFFAADNLDGMLNAATPHKAVQVEVMKDNIPTVIRLPK